VWHVDVLLLFRL